MFNLEINFLKDRVLAEERKATQAEGGKAAFNLGEQAPILIGVGIMALSWLLAGGISWYVNAQADESQKNIQQLDQQLTTFKSDKAKLANIQAELGKVKDETKAVVNVFGQVQSVSALLQDIGDQLPRGMSVNSIEQSDLAATPESGGLPVNQIKISGLSKDFEGVNDFLLTLQKSPFLNPKKTRIDTATLVDAKLILGSAGKLPKGTSVSQDGYTITTKTPKQIQNS